MVETVTDIEAAQKALLDGSISPYEFDQKYGQDAANSVMRGTYKTPEQIAEAAAAAEKANRGILQQAGAVAGDVIRGITNGVEEAINETAQTVNYAGENLEDFLGVGRLVWEDSNGDGKTDLVPSYWSREKVVANRDKLKQDAITNFVENELEFIDAPEGVTGNVAQGISQFVTGFVALGGARTFAGSMLKGAVVDATVFDPYENNLSAFLEENNWANNAVTEALKTDPNAPEWENRLTNALEGGLTGLALEGAVRAIKFVAVGRKVNTEIKELGKISDETADELDAAHEKAVEAEEAISNSKNDQNALASKPDGTFEAPDGTVYRPDGEDKLVEVPRAEEPAPVTQAADQLDEVTAPEGAPRVEDPNALPRTEVDPNAPDAPKQPELTRDQQLGANLKSQIDPEVVRVNPKIGLIDTQRFSDALDRAREMGDFELRNIDEGGFFNLGRMEGPVEAAKIIDSFQEVLASTNGFKRMGLDKPETHDKVLRDALKYTAENTGTDVNKLIRDLNVRETMSRDMASRIVAGKMALQSTGREINALAEKVDLLVQTGRASEEVERKLVDLMQMHTELQANVKGLQTAAARATSAGRIMTNDALSDVALDSLSAFGGSKRVRQLAQNLKRIKDDAARAKYVRKAVERKWLRVLNEYWINQILSGYTTHALNLTSNTANLLIRPAERGVGALFRLEGEEAIKAFKTYQYLGYYLKDAIATAAKAGWNHRAILDTNVKVDTMMNSSSQRAISADYLGVKNKYGALTLDTLGKGLTMSSRALGTEDEFFKQLAFRSNLRANLTVDAARMTADDLKKLGYQSKDDFVKAEFEKAFETKISAEERWQEMVITQKVQDDAKVKAEFIERSIGGANLKSKYAQQALREAREATFTTPLKKGTMSGDIQTLANKHPVLRQLMPFIQTPMNIMTNAWDRTPLFNLLRNEYKEAFNSPDPTIRSEAAGKMALGFAIYGSLTFLAVNGRITGGGPTDPRLANIWRNSKDWQPYSINVGTAENPHWISYQRMDPWTTAFGIVGDIAEMIEVGQMADTEASDLMSMAIVAFGNNVVSKTYLQGISDMVDILHSKDNPEKVGALFRQRAASMLPYSSMLGQFNSAQDPYLREARTYLDTFKRQSGVGRSELPMKMDWITGQPLETPERTLGYINVKKVGPEDRDASLIYTEMRKLGYRFGGAERKIGGVTLTPQQYQRWNELMGTTKRGGKTLSQRLVSQIESSRYRKDDDDYNMVTPQESHRVQMLNQEISRYRTAARQALMKEYPELRDAVRNYDRYVSMTQRGRQGERPEIDMNNIMK